ncbi:hypothetical protein D9M70_383940 [compost metagenome]
MPDIAIDKYYDPDLELSYVFAHMLFPRNEDEKFRKLYLAHETLNGSLNPHKHRSDNALIPKEIIKIVTSHGKPQNDFINNTNCEHGASVGRIFLSLLRIHASDIPICITGARALAASEIAVATNSLGRKAHSLSTETLQASTRRYKSAAHFWASLVFIMDMEAEARSNRENEKANTILKNLPKILIGTAETLAQLYQGLPRKIKYQLPFREDEFWRYPLTDDTYLGVFLPENLSQEEAAIVYEARSRNPSTQR